MIPTKLACVESQHRAGRKFMRKLRAMSEEERAAFYAEEEQKLRELQQRARTERKLQPASKP